jgi:hypothetical protein
MPLYQYTHEACGFDQRFYLDENVNSKIIDCYRCGRKVTARQVRDPKLKIGEADGVKGVIERGTAKREMGKSGH